MRYFIRFVGHVIQQPGVVMPLEVYYDVISEFEKEDYEPQTQGEKVGLKQFVNVLTFQLMEHGMVVPKHMIAYIDCIVKPLVVPPPTLPPDLAMFETEEPGTTIINGDTVN